MKTAEWVSPKHPDKLCDQISDAILDACLEQDPMSRVAIETFGCHGVINVGGELTTKAFVDVRKIVNRIVPNYGVQVNIVQQSPEIARGVDADGAGDQGIMTGYACNDNEDMIPQELFLARSVGRYIYGGHLFDGKTQMTIEDNGDIKTIVASFQNVSKQELYDLVVEWLEVSQGITESDGIEILCNPAGDWGIGGFDADTGLTGRKLMVDNYGPQVPIGGGCFSGKDATKVDRSAAYMARKIALDILKEYNDLQKDTESVLVKLAYAIGVAQPVMATAYVDMGFEFSGNKRDCKIDLLKKYHYDLTPNGIINFLELRKPQFEKMAREGHFGNGYLWDK